MTSVRVEPPCIGGWIRRFNFDRKTLQNIFLTHPPVPFFPPFHFLLPPFTRCVFNLAPPCWIFYLPPPLRAQPPTLPFFVFVYTYAHNPSCLHPVFTLV